MSTRRPGSRACSQRGQGTIEFQIVGFMVLLPLLMGVIQMGLLIVSKNTLNVATLGAARAGAASGGDRAAMQNALDIGLAPLHANTAKVSTGVGMADITTGNYAAVMTASLALSKALDKPWSRITVLNPTAKSFLDFGASNKLGTVIPVTNVYDNAAVGDESRQTRADALLLKIEVRYCEELAIPIIKDLILLELKSPLNAPSADDLLCYMQERVPLKSQAIVRMTVAPIQQKLFP
jgi:hypothetical protein